MYLLCVCSHDITLSGEPQGSLLEHVCSSIPLYPADPQLQNGAFCKLDAHDAGMVTNCSNGPAHPSCLFQV